MYLKKINRTVMHYHRMLFRVILALLVITASSILAGCKEDRKQQDIHVSHDEIYTCPMHPEIIRHEPGNCPICGMPLVKKENAQMEMSKVDLSTLLQSSDNTVMSSIPVTALQISNEDIKLEALGIVDYDTRYLKTISARVPGRIEKLYIKYRFQSVRAGDKVMEIYSPQLVTDQQNLLFLVKNDPENQALISAAKQKLLLLGLSSNQVEKIVSSGKPLLSVTIYSNYTGHVHEAGNMANAAEQINPGNETGALTLKEGMYVEKDQPVFQVNDMHHVWINLNFFPGENSLIKTGHPVTIVPEAAPDQKIVANIGFIEPFYKDGARTLSARVYWDNSKLMLPVGSRVKATLHIHTSQDSWLPKESVLSLGVNKVVFLKRGNTFEAHPVRTGIAANNRIQIIGGLDAEDSVAVNAQFLIDSEGFIKVNK